MPTDWAPGDLALCVDTDADWHDFRGPAQGPKLGEANAVQHVELLACPIVCADGTVYEGAMLGFAKWPGVAFWHGSFRKITPLTEDEEREARREIEQDKRVTAPAKVGEPVYVGEFYGMPVFEVPWLDFGEIRFIPNRHDVGYR